MFEKFTGLLREYVSFKSISTDPRYHDEMLKTADWLEAYFTSNGFVTKRLTADGINPFIFAECTVDPTLPTVLVYGHYDVQPAEQSDGWQGDPFTLTERDNKLIARGVVDNKGQLLVHLVTVVEALKRGELTLNVKFLIEGNEESGNPKMSEILTTHKELLASDFILISDGQIVRDIPTIETSLRGGFSLTVRYKTALTSIHSGLYGGAAPNAAHELSKTIAALYDQNNRCTIAGFYDDTQKITAEQKANNAALAGAPEEFFGPIGITKLVTTDNIDPITQTGLLPTLQVTGLKSGYIHDGYANIIPNEAEAKINVRLVPFQTPDEVQVKIRHHFESCAPEYVSVSVTMSDAAPPVQLSSDSSLVRAARELLQKAFHKEPALMYCGGSLPLVLEMKEILGKDPLLVSLANSDCRMHGVDENFSIDMAKKGLAFSSLFFRHQF